MKVGAVMIMEKVVVKRPVMVIKKMSFEEAKNLILDEVARTEDFELIGAAALLLRTIERKRDARN